MQKLPTLKTESQEKNERLEFVLAIIFVGIVLVPGYLLDLDFDLILRSLTWFDFVIIVLAVFRLTRLFVYDGIMAYLRSCVLIKEMGATDMSDQATVVYTYPKVGLRKILADLLACPWCVGMWLSALVIILFYAVPVSKFFILILAVAGLSTFCQIISNAIGWKAEKEKLIVQAKQ